MPCLCLYRIDCPHVRNGTKIWLQIMISKRNVCAKTWKLLKTSPRLVPVSLIVVIVIVAVVMVVIVVIVAVTIIVIACDRGCLQHAMYSVIQFMHHDSVVVVRWSVHLFLPVALLSRCLSNHPLYLTTFWHMYLWEVLLWHTLHVANPQFYCKQL